MSRAARTHTPITLCSPGCCGLHCCLCPVQHAGPMCPPWSLLQKGHQRPFSYSRTKYPPGLSVKGSEREENQMRQRTNILAIHSFKNSILCLQGVTLSASTWRYAWFSSLVISPSPCRTAALFDLASLELETSQTQAHSNSPPPTSSLHWTLRAIGKPLQARDPVCAKGRTPKPPGKPA